VCIRHAVRTIPPHRLRVDQEEGTLTSIGFADNSDVSKDAVIPWIPLKAGQWLIFSNHIPTTC